jgi:hypothetical protein
MAKVDVTSFTCRDEQEFLSDEAYVIVTSDTGASRTSSTYEDLDTGDTINPVLDPLDFDFSAIAELWEDDGPKGVSPEDDFIGFTGIDPNNTGTHTATLQGSGGEYDLTYFLG